MTSTPVNQSRNVTPSIDAGLSNWTQLKGGWVSPATGQIAMQAGSVPTGTAGNAVAAVSNLVAGGQTTVTGTVNLTADQVWGGIASNIQTVGDANNPDYYVLRMKKVGANSAWQLIRMVGNVADTPGILASGVIWGGTGSSYGFTLTTSEGGNTVIRISHDGTNDFRQELTIPAALRLGGGMAGVYSMSPAIRLSGVTVRTEGTGTVGSVDTSGYRTATVKAKSLGASNTATLGARQGSYLWPDNLGEVFEVAVTVKNTYTAGRAWAGIAFNATTQGQYVLRYSPGGSVWQLVDIGPSGSSADTTLVQAGSLGSNFDATKPVTLTVTKSSVGRVSVGVAQGTTQLVSTDVTLPTTSGAARTGGQAGLWGVSDTTAFTGFSVTSRTGWVTDVNDRMDYVASPGMGIAWRQLVGAWKQNDGSGSASVVTASNVVPSLMIRSEINPMPDTGYAVSADVTAQAGSNWSGIAWNATDANNLSTLQVNPSAGTWRLLQITGGQVDTIAYGNAKNITGKAVTLSVTQDSADGKGIAVSGVSGGKRVFSTRVTLDDQITGGHAGLIAGSTGVSFRNFAQLRLGDAPLSTKPIATMTFNRTVNASVSQFTPVNGSKVAGTSYVTLPFKTYSYSHVGQSTILSPDGKRQYVTFYNQDGRIMVGWRDVSAGPQTPFDAKNFVVLNDPASPNATLTRSDSHNYLTMAFGPDGNLYVSGNMHASAMTLFKTTTPGDISTFTPLHNLVDATLERSVTYPAFISMPAVGGNPARFVYTFRSGHSGDGEQVFYATTDGKTWSKMAAPVVGTSADGSTYSAYFTGNGPIYKDGWFYLSWDWRKGNGDAGNGTQVLLMRSRDFANWETMSGDKLGSTVTFDTYKQHPSLVVADMPTQCGQLNGLFNLGFDKNDQPLVSYDQFDSCDLGPGTTQMDQYQNGWGANQVHVARWDSVNNQWDEKQVTALTSRWAPHGGGAIPFSLGVGAVSPLLSSYGKINVQTTGDVLVLPLSVGSGNVVTLDAKTMVPLTENGWRNATPYIDYSGKNPGPLGSGMAWTTASTTVDQTGNRYLMLWSSYPITTDANGNSSDSIQHSPLNPQPVYVFYASQ